MIKSFRIALAIIFVLFAIESGQAQQSTIVQNIINQVNIDTLVQFVKELSGNVPTKIGGQPYTILSRHKNQPGNDKAQQWIQEKFQQYGFTPVVQSFSTTGKNVYAVQTGTEFPNKKYMICAHFDDMPSGTTAPGADDNASGTAAVLEAARILRNYSFPFTIVYALWDEEEQGLIGSEYYAEQASLAGDSIMGVINLDMIAWDSNNDSKAEIHTRPIGSSNLITSKMYEVNTTYGLGVVLSTINPGSTYSDHASFWTSGYGAILLIELDGDFNAYYHTVNDLVTQASFNKPYFAKLSKLAIGTLATFLLNLNLTIQHTAFASINTSSPINLSATVVSGLEMGTGAAGPKLYYRVNQGSGYGQFAAVSGTPAEGTTVYNFTIPAQPMGTSVQYYIAAQDVAGAVVATSPAGGSGVNPPGGTPPSTFHHFYVAQSTVAFTDSANSTSQWTTTYSWGTTTSKYVSPPTSFTDSPSGNYLANTNSSMMMNNAVDLSNILGANLSFDVQFDIETDWDYCQIQITTDNGSSWTPLAGQYTNLGTGSFQPNGQPLYDGVQSSWVRENIDLSPYAGKQVKFRFWLRSDGSLQKDGIYIDNLTVSKYSVVPVELSSMSAQVGEGVINLYWTTGSEVNNRGFEISRSADKKSWEVLGFVDGYGTTSEPKSYAFTDSKPLNSKSWYTIKQVDFDGTAKVYGPVEADLLGSLTYSLEQNYPNPFNPTTSIKFSILKKGWVSLAVFDLLGREITTLINKETEAGTHTVNFDASELVSGIYVYQLKSADFISTKKMMLVK